MVLSMCSRNESCHGEDDSIVASYSIIIQVDQWALNGSAYFILELFYYCGGDSIVARETVVLSRVELSGVDAVLN